MAAFFKSVGRVRYKDYVKSLSPRAYWRLGESSGSTATDEMGNHNGVYVDDTNSDINIPSASSSSPGASLISGDADSSQDFDGIDHFVRIADAPELDGQVNFSWCCWVKMDDPNATKEQRFIGKGEVGATLVWEISRRNPSTNNDIRASVNSSISGTVSVTTTSGINTNANFWACTYKSGVSDGILRLYLNGSEIGSVAALGTVQGSNNSPVSIGRKDGTTPTFFDGRIDEAAVFHSTLEANSILEMYKIGAGTYTGEADLNFTLPGQQAYRSEVLADSPSVYWRLNETSGTTAATEVGSITGTITGASLNQAGAFSGTGTSFSFDGVDDKVESAAQATPAAGYSVEFFFKANSLQERWVAGFADTGGSGSFFPLVGITSSGSVKCLIGVGPSVQTFSGFTYSAGTWYHVVVTVSGTTATLYVDGTSRGTLTVDSSVGGGPLHRIGQISALGDGGINGFVDEYAWFPSPLSSTRVSAHYTARNTSADESPIGSYLAKKSNKALISTLSSSADVAFKYTAKLFQSSLSLTPGALFKLTRHQLLGNSSFSSSVFARAGKLLISSLSFESYVARAVSRAVQSSLTFTSTIVGGRLSFMALSAAVSFSSSIARATSRQVISSLVFTKTLIRRISTFVGTQFGGSLQLSSELKRLISVSGSGALSFSSTVSGVVVFLMNVFSPKHIASVIFKTIRGKGRLS